MSTQATVAHHLQAIAQGLDAVMGDYSEGSVLFTPDGPRRGLAEIRSFFAAFIANSPPELIRAFTLIRQDVDGEAAYILWKADPYIPLATDTFVVRDGKILVQSFAALAPAPRAG